MRIDELKAQRRALDEDISHRDAVVVRVWHREQQARQRLTGRSLTGKTKNKLGASEFFFFCHPPVLRAARIGEGNRGYAMVRNGVTC